MSNRQMSRDGAGRRQEEEEWVPTTDLGILVKLGKITLEDIFKYSMRISEPGIIDHLIGKRLKEEVIKVQPIQKQTKAGQRTRMKATVVVGDGNGYVGIGFKSAKEAAVAIKGAISRAKCAIRPVKLGYWGSAYGDPHTVPCKSTGKSGSVIVRVIPAPKGSGLEAGGVPKKIFQLAGVKDVITASKGMTSTTENFAKATIHALDKASSFFTPNMWGRGSGDINPILVNSSEIRKYSASIGR